MTAIEKFLAEVRVDVERRLDALLPAADARPIRLHEAIRWSVFGGGKRIRPAIVFAVGEAFGARRATLSDTAAAVEMIHTYSLIHDDLPAMDDDDLRRGRATCHRQFDEATAILAGDALQTLAFKTISNDDSLSPAKRLRVISVLAEAAGTPDGMIAGQQLDLEAEGRRLLIDGIEEIHRQKTGALITCAAVAGSIIGDACEAEIAAVTNYAKNLGLLFQVTDDLLDVTQPTLALGKTAGKDAAASKATYVSHLGIDQARTTAGDIGSRAREALRPLDRDTRTLNNLVTFVADRSR